MSHQASAWALDARQTGRLGAGARLVLATLADYADPQGHGAYPSKATIGARLDLDVDTVRKHLRTLELAGILLRGDQALVAHYPADKRPTVYNLALRRDPSEMRPRSSDPSNDAGATPQNVPERPLKSEVQTKDITTNENYPPNPPLELDDDIDHDSPQALALEHAQAEARRYRLNADGEVPVPPSEEDLKAIAAGLAARHAPPVEGGESA
jgi:hypothetical protein